MGLKSDIREILSDGDGYLSSKRVITMSAFLLVAISYILDALFDITIDPVMLSGMIQIVWAGLGVTVGEHLLKVRSENNDNAYEDSNSKNPPYKNRRDSVVDPKEIPPWTDEESS